MCTKNVFCQACLIISQRKRQAKPVLGCNFLVRPVEMYPAAHTNLVEKKDKKTEARLFELRSVWVMRSRHF